MIEKIAKYKHIIWDWNGTLINDVWLVVEIMNKMLKKRKLPNLKLGFDFSKESFEELTVEFIGEYYVRFNECKLFDKVEEVLKKIRDRGISQSVLSMMFQNIWGAIVYWLPTDIIVMRGLQGWGSMLSAH